MAACAFAPTASEWAFAWLAARRRRMTLSAMSMSVRMSAMRARMVSAAASSIPASLASSANRSGGSSDHAALMNAVRACFFLFWAICASDIMTLSFPEWGR